MTILGKVLAAIAATALTVVTLAPAAFASSGPGITVAPFSFSAVGLGTFTPTGGPAVDAEWLDLGSHWELRLAKNVPTSEVAAAGAHLTGVKGLPTSGTTLSFTLEPISYCSGGSPRFNVYLEGVAAPVFLGCANGDRVGSVVSFTAGQHYGGVLFPTGQTVDKIDLIQDEQGVALLNAITIYHVSGSHVDNVVATGPGNTRR